MSTGPDRRKPRAFDIPPGPGAAPGPEPQSAGGDVRETVRMRRPRAFAPGPDLQPEPEDYFEREDVMIDDALVEKVEKGRRRLSFASIAISALGAFASLALGLWVDGIVRALFARNEWLGWVALGLAAVLALSVLFLVAREVAAILRLRSVVHLRRGIEDALAGGDPVALDRETDRLIAHMAANAATASGRAVLDAQRGEILDAEDRYALAERELFRGLDRDAFTLVMGSSKRVSVVTAVSPRAFIDILYVLYENFRMVRRMFELYGGRSGALGNIRLFRTVLGHLAVTGAASLGDGIVQQVVGHGLASRLSARLGEGVLNGMMTARVGLAAMDVCRPAPFHAVGKPKLSSVVATLSDQSRAAASAAPRDAET